MKKTILVLVTVILTFELSAQSIKIDSWIKPTQNEIQNTSSIFVKKKLNEKLTFVAFALTSTTGFAESYFGLSTNIAKNTSISLSIGFQSKSEKPLRFASSFFTKKGGLSFLAIGEYGINKTYWYKYYAKKSFKKFSYGVYGQRFAGHGARIDYTFGKMGVWTSILYDTEATAINIPLGIYIKF